MWRPRIKSKAIRAYFHHGQVGPSVVTKNKHALAGLVSLSHGGVKPSKISVSKQRLYFQRASNLFQRPSNPRPKGCVFQPPIPPKGVGRPARWKAGQRP
jgi:hypothetical protein